MFPYSSIHQYHSSLQHDEVSCVEAVQHYLQKILSLQRLNAFVHVFNEEALQQATVLDLKRKAGKPIGKLHGVIVAIKDVICYKDHPVTAASGILKNFTSIYSATIIEKLLQEEAIIIGVTNCDEFAMGSTSENSVYGKVLNAADESRVPGGSSGGSAVAVQAGLCMVSLGSDTGGSVRQPADFCGITGLKFCIFFYWYLRNGTVIFIMPGYYFKNPADIFNAICKNAYLIKRRSVSNQPIPGYTAIGWF